MTIQGMQRLLGKITEASLQEVEMRTAIRHQDEYIYQQTRQMYAGKWDTGAMMSPYMRDYYPYVDEYIARKASLGKVVDRVTLNLYGPFFDNMYITRKDNTLFTISSKVRSDKGYNYQPWLEWHYTQRKTSPRGNNSIWGIGTQYLDRYLYLIKAPFVDEVINEFF